MDRKTGNIVTADTCYRKIWLLRLFFEPISIYTIKVNYFYQNKSANQNVIFDSETFQLDDSDIPYRITPPASTKVYEVMIRPLPADAIYYPQQPLIEITRIKIATLANQEDKTITMIWSFVPYTAEYDFVYLLKDLTGDGYTEIERVHAYGILGSTVTAQILNYSYADFEKWILSKSHKEMVKRIKGLLYSKIIYLKLSNKWGSYIDPKRDFIKRSCQFQTFRPKKDIPLLVGIQTRN